MRTNLPNTIVNVLGVLKGKLSCYDTYPVTRLTDCLQSLIFIP